MLVVFNISPLVINSSLVAYMAQGRDTISNKPMATKTSLGPLAVNLLVDGAFVITAERPSLHIMVTERNGMVISGAQVCLYPDLVLIQQYHYKWSGSSRFVNNEEEITRKGAQIFVSLLGL